MWDSFKFRLIKADRQWSCTLLDLPETMQNDRRLRKKQYGSETHARYMIKKPCKTMGDSLNLPMFFDTLMEGVIIWVCNYMSSEVQTMCGWSWMHANINWRNWGNWRIKFLSWRLWEHWEILQMHVYHVWQLHVRQYGSTEFDSFVLLVCAQEHMQTLQKVEEEVSKVRTRMFKLSWDHHVDPICEATDYLRLAFSPAKEPVAIADFECEGRCLRLRCCHEMQMLSEPAPSGKLHPLNWNLGTSRGQGAS